MITNIQRVTFIGANVITIMITLSEDDCNHIINSNNKEGSLPTYGRNNNYKYNILKSGLPFSINISVNDLRPWGFSHKYHSKLQSCQYMITCTQYLQKYIILKDFLVFRNKIEQCRAKSIELFFFSFSSWLSENAKAKYWFQYHYSH